MPLKTRNRLTMTVWWSILFNLLALEISNAILVCLNITSTSVNKLTEYTLESFANYFFINAVMYQTFEWDLLGSMIFFQSQHQVRELVVVREIYNVTEKRKLKATKYIVGLNILYYIIKVAVPLSTLVNCFKLGVGNGECDKITTHRITLMVYADTIYNTLMFIYVLFAVIKLIVVSWKYSRLEARSHMF